MRHLAIGAVISMGLAGLVAIGIASAAEHTERGSVREELWAIPSAIPMLAYVVRPLASGSNPLVVMNHGISLDPTERSFFPLIEFRDAALWFAQQGYVVVAPIRSGYGLTATEVPERGLFSVDFSSVGRCSEPRFRDAGLAVAAMDGWVIDYMTGQPFVQRDKVVIVGTRACFDPPWRDLDDPCEASPLVFSPRAAATRPGRL